MHGEFLSQLLVRSRMRMLVLPVDDITHFTSEEHITFVHTAGLRYDFEASLSVLERQLDPRHFVRVHRNAIVNLTCVRCFLGRASAHVVLHNGVTVRVSREKCKLLKKRFGL